MPPVFPPSQDDFKPTGKPYELPPEVESLDALSRQRVAICSLFSHQNVEVRDISRILGIEHSNTVKTLLEAGLIQERRKNLQRPQVEQPAYLQDPSSDKA